MLPKCFMFCGDLSIGFLPVHSKSGCGKTVNDQSLAIRSSQFADATPADPNDNEFNLAMTYCSSLWLRASLHAGLCLLP